MSHSTRRTLLTGAATCLALLGLPAIGFAQTADGFDDGNYYQDKYGRFFRKRGGRYVPANAPAGYGQPAPDPQAATPDAGAYGRPPAQRYGAQPDEQPATPQPADPARKQAGWQMPKQTPDDSLDYARVYGPASGEPFSLTPVNWKRMNPAFLRQEVAYNSSEPPGTIVVDPRGHFLYLIQGNGRARRYGVGVGKQGFAWSGAANINSKQAWPDWYPPAEMIARRPDLKGQVSVLQSGLGVAGGARNPLGARAMYLWQNNKDTLFRIHGTNEPETIGHSVSSGCIRMINQDAIDLFNRVDVGARVVVL